MENPFDILLQKLEHMELLLEHLLRQRTGSNPVVLPPRILTTDEAASVLGLSKSTLYKLTAQRAVPHYKKGKKIYFKQEELEQWLTEHRVATREDIEREAMEYLQEKRRLRKKG